MAACKRLSFAAAIAFAAVTAMAMDALGLPAPALAQQASIVQTIRVVGNRRIEAEAVRSHLAFGIGQRFDPAKVDQSLKALFATGLFKDVHIDFERGVAVVSVVENPLINRVAFEGNKELGSDELAKAIALKAGAPLAVAKVQAAVQSILADYSRQGFYAAQADPKTIELDKGRVDLVFEIREGPKSKVAGINFIGNKAFSDAQLRAAISTSESGLLDFLKSNIVYDPERLNLDRDLLRRYYLKNGYADMRVVSAIADADQEGKGFFLTFTIDEGPRYTFSGVDIQVDVPKVDASALRKRVVGEDGDIYNVESVEKTVDAITAAVAEQGQPFGQVRTRVERDQARRTISVLYAVEQGPRLYIERIEIVGNTRTNITVILREFRVAEGDAYNKVMIDRGRQRLLKLGFFKDVKIAKEPGSAPDRVTLKVDLEEQSTGEFAFATGYSTAEGVIGEVTYTERNLMGTGQYLQIKLTGSFVSGGASISWTEPRFLDSNLAFGVDLFIRNSDYTAATGYLVAGYEDFRFGGGFHFGLPITDELSFNPHYTLTWDTVYNLDPNASLAVKQIQGTALISAVGYSLIYDTRNSKKKPTRGFYFIGTQDFAGAGGSVNYIRSTTEMRAYYPLTQDITLAGRSQDGTIMGWGGQDVRIVDAFYKGSDLIRGFQTGGLGPRDASTGDALGGTTFYSATAEIRFPLPFVPQDMGLSVAGFTDAGSLFGTDAQKFAAAYVATHGGTNTLAVQNSAIIRASAGASLVWDSPVGPLSADFSGIVSKAPYDKTQTFGFGYTGW
jgi:outer membrane protein insertion porin family